MTQPDLFGVGAPLFDAAPAPLIASGEPFDSPLDDLPTFLRRGHPDCVATAGRFISDEITLSPGRQRKKKKTPATCATLRALGYSTYEISKLNRAEGERIAHKRIRKEPKP